MTRTGEAADGLVRDARHHRHQQHLESDPHCHRKHAERREDDDADERDHDEETGPTARMETAAEADVGDVDGAARLEAVDRLVLGAVVLEEPAHAAQAPDQRQVAEQDERSQDALEEDAADAALRAAMEHAGERERQADEEHQREDRRDGDGGAQGAGTQLRVLPQLHVRGPLQRAHPQREHLVQPGDAAQERPRPDRVGVEP